MGRSPMQSGRLVRAFPETMSVVSAWGMCGVVRVGWVGVACVHACVHVRTGRGWVCTQAHWHEYVCVHVRAFACVRLRACVRACVRV